ncbi:hypothetical protein [Labrys monachus]|uniref:phospholipase D n=1 Tax=Labrys monachus TaxID=217067 RepID=A0ABU0FEJ3_9HYPH|nr:hypothetical protein [Labrys monachus]MDQ0392866.1 phosphatidylserine/phosphatidylglycerophosphate/cardiolipin synthase-like enzyme [Labrys monachus]
MVSIVKAIAFSNNEVGFLAWRLDHDLVEGCLGFNIVREYLDEGGDVTLRRPLASYVPFLGQHNTKWQAQNTTIWPIQKFTWRDLTLRKKRDGSGRRPDNERVRYQIRAVGDLKPGLEKVETIPESHIDRATGQVVAHTYDGPPRALGYLTPAAFTNVVEVTALRPPFRATFTNGILSTQFLRNVLSEDGKVEDGELVRHLTTPGDWLRNYLTGDVIPLMHDFFEKNVGGRFRAALYELDDKELVDLLAVHADRIDLILSDAGDASIEGSDGAKQTIYDTRNSSARQKLRAIADRPGSKFRLINRMFNGSGHIGHNKFVVFMPNPQTATQVLTGSTNWTSTGIAGQSNNCTVIDDAVVAAGYVSYWDQMFKDKQMDPVPLNAVATGAGQGDDLKKFDLAPVTTTFSGGATLEAWYSPNVPGASQPTTSKTKAPSVPPDMARLFSFMRQAKRSIFFLIFYPSQGGTNSIVGEAINLGIRDTSLEVIGAISDPKAMWLYQPGRKAGSGPKIPAWSPHVFQQAGVSVVRATALTDKNLVQGLGDFKLNERLTAFGNGAGAIIHDKILVIDPMDSQSCVVAFGSHNQGYKASYSNDENLVIVRGHQGIAQAYAAHVLDVYDHYKFRATEAEIAAKQKGQQSTAGPDQTGWEGFLKTSDSWQKTASRRLASYFTE